MQDCGFRVGTLHHVQIGPFKQSRCGLLNAYLPALILLDLNMPGHSGLDVLRDVKFVCPRLRVIIVSVQPKDQYAMRCLQAGADAYINKDKAPEELGLAIRKLCTVAALSNGTS